MNTHLAYGKYGLDLQLDDRWNIQVVEPCFVPGIEDPQQALQNALKSPIGSPPLPELITARDSVGIVVNDLTRAAPSERLLQALLSELSHVPKQRIRIFISLGTHRRNTAEELQQMLGAYATAGFEIIQNDAFNPDTQISLGFTSRGNEIWINRELAQCSAKILTGFIEPHFFAGFSGAGKAIMPGMAGLRTVMRNHCARNIADPMATWGVTWGNPIWEEIREAAQQAGKIFLLNVTLNKYQEISSIFAGDLDEAYEQGVGFLRKTAMAVVEHPFDIVITTNSGYPLDINLYQTVKGMSVAAQIVKRGGAILIASECRDGIPEHGMYERLLRQAGSPKALLEMVSAANYMEQDQWQAQIQAQIQLKADVYVHSRNLTEEQIRGVLLNPAVSLQKTLAALVDLHGQSARICVLPEGPQTIPCLREEKM
jgi:nickel-dependent lactate racemase